MNSTPRFARRFSRVLLTLAFIAALAGLRPAAAQILYSSIVGNVLDESGGAVAGAAVTSTSRETNQVRHTTTNAEGTYSFPNLPSGTYTIRVTMQGFAPYARQDVIVAINTTARVDAKLALAGVAEQVTVAALDAQIEPLQTDRAEIRHELNEAEIKNLPVPIGRNYQMLFQTLPGFELEGSPRETRMGGCNPSRSRRYNVNGASRSGVATLIDGAASAHVWNVGNSAIVPALESIETVNVAANSFDAEQGLAGGAVVNVQIKSGTNTFHGSAFEYHHNQHLRARPFFMPPSQGKGKFISNQYGGTLGGPIRKDKLFFFGSMERRHERENSTAILSVPGAAVRTGDFSAQGAPIYDPQTGNFDGVGRTPFPGNRIPADRISPVALNLLSRLPLPNINPGSEQNNFFASVPFAANNWAADGKVNWYTTENLNVFGSVSLFDFDIDNPTAFGDEIDGARVGGGNAGLSFGRNTRLSFGVNRIFTPTMLMDAFFGFNRQNTNVRPPGLGTNWGQELGLPGTNGPNEFQSGWPFFSVSGYAAIGTEEPWTPYFRNDDQYNMRANFTKTHGTHELRWGFDVNSEQMNHTQPEFQGGASMGARGRFNFGVGPTALCLAANPRGGCNTIQPTVNQVAGLSSFLLGLPIQVGKNQLNEFPFTTRTWRYSLYVRDRWQITRKLTLNFGTRWEYFPMPTRADRGFERYDPDTNQMFIGGLGNVPKDLGVKNSKRLFAPRFGVAYRATDNTVIRAGYGISIDPFSLARPLRTNHPVLVELVSEQPNNMQPSSLLSQGIPAIETPTLGNGIIPVPFNVSTQTVPLEFPRGYLQSWNFTIERNIGAGFVAETAYVATRQIRQLGYRQLNWAPIGGGNPGRQLFSAFGRTANTRIADAIGNSRYDSLQAQLRRRFWGGYSVNVAYTLAKSITTSGSDVSDAELPINIPEYYHLNRSVSSFDRRHNLQITNIFELPFGKGKRWGGNNRLVSVAAGGWQFNSIVALQSGRPFSVLGPGASLNAPGSTQRADQVKPEVQKLGGIGLGQPWFDPTAFAPVNEARFGTAGFNSMYGPGRVNWDLSAFRNFAIGERVNLQFRAEAFNVTNTPKFGNPGSNVGSVQYNTDGSIRNLNGFGDITTASEERQFSLGLRLSF